MARLKNAIRNVILKNVPAFIKNDIISKFQEEICFDNSSFAQEGEDRVLLRFLEEKKDGFYIDIGAHHPTRFSNTYLFYLKGWRGINIDATPGSMKKFAEIRPNDVNIEASVFDIAKKMKFYMFNEPALNTFDEELANSYVKKGWELSKSIVIHTQTLSNILNQYKIKKEIDFLSIDVEGLELNVLQSIDWTSFNPKIILIEELKFNFQNVENNPIYFFLINKGYQLVAKTFNTVFYKKINT